MPQPTDATPSRSTLDELSSEVERLASLARSLVSDRARVDDVVQQAWVVALQQAGRSRRSGALRPWLAGVVRNLSRQGARAEARRVQRETEAARRGLGEGRDSELPPDEVVARAELHRRLVGAVLALPDPFRTTVLLRYFEDRSTQDIARHLGVPANTVRTRLKRGLDRLRNDLGARLGLSDERAALALIPLALPREGALLATATAAAGSGAVGTATTTTSDTLLAGMLAMNTTLKFTVVAGLLALTSAMLWWNLGPTDATYVPATNAVSSSPPTVAGPPGNTTVPGTPTSVEPLALSESPPAHAATTNGADDDSTPDYHAVVFRGRVVDHNGRPLSGATVIHEPGSALSWRRRLGTDWLEYPWKQSARATTDEQGRFELATHEIVPRASDPLGRRPGSSTLGVRPPYLVVVRAGFEPRRQAFEEAWRTAELSVGDIVLQPGRSVIGRLVDPEGQPVAGALIRPHISDESSDEVWQTGNTQQRLLVETSGATGEFELAALHRHTAQLSVLVEGFEDRRLILEGHSAGAIDLGDVVLSRGGSLAGRVVDEVGAPLADVKLRARDLRVVQKIQGTDTVAHDIAQRAHVVGRRIEVETRTDETGRFRLTGLGGGGYLLLASKPGREPARINHLSAGRDDLVLTLRPEASLALRIVDDASGTPIVDAEVTAHRRAGESVGVWDPQLTLTSGADASRVTGEGGDGRGLVLVHGVGTVGTAVTVITAGYATLGVVLPGVAVSERVEHTLRLAPAARLHGQVLNAAGQPLADARVELVASGNALLNPAVQHTDNEGRFAFQALAAGPWELSARALGHLPIERRRLQLDAGQAARQDLTLGRAAVISGRVVDASGTAAGRQRVSLGRLKAVGEPALEHAVSSLSLPDGRTLSVLTRTRSDRQGRFSLEEVPAGTWMVCASPGGEAHLTLDAGDTREIEIALREPHWLSVRVVDADGPVEGAGIKVYSGEGTALALSMVAPFPGHTDSEGRWNETVAALGRHTFIATHGGTWSTARVLDLGWGRESVVELSFGSSELTGRIVDAASGEAVADASIVVTNQTLAARHATRQRPSPVHVTRAGTDAEGHFRVGRLHAGEHTITAQGGTLAPQTVSVTVASGVPVESLTLALGAGAALVVRLETAPGETVPLPCHVEVEDNEGATLDLAALTAEPTHVFEGLRAGTYRVVVKPGARADGNVHTLLAEGQVTVEAGERRVLVLTAASDG